MSNIQIKKMAVSFALLAFAILMFGSMLTGSRMTTAFIRGVEAAIVFGALAWSFGSIVMGDQVALVEEEDTEESTDVPQDETI